MYPPSTSARTSTSREASKMSRVAALSSLALRLSLADNPHPVEAVQLVDDPRPVEAMQLLDDGQAASTSLLP
jgi:hypothetical protein